jgi:RNA polymerase sigma-70 factor (ECF subfamily)
VTSGVEEGVAGGSREEATIAALAQIYERGYRRFLRVAEAIVLDPELARDVIQDAFARAIRGRFDYRGEGSLEGWVWRTVVNVAKNARRDRPPAHVPLHELAEEPPALNGSVPQSEVRAVLVALPERQRLVLFLRYYADLDYRRIAEALGIETGTVGATLSQAHAVMRGALEEVAR